MAAISHATPIVHVEASSKHPSPSPSAPKFAKAKQSRWATGATLTFVALAIFAADFLLLGDAGDANRTSWLCDLEQLWTFVRSSNMFALDCYCVIFFGSVIAWQLLSRCKPVPNTDTHCAKSASPSKGSKHSGDRRNSPSTFSTPPEARGSASSERQARVAKLNQAIDYAARLGDFHQAGQLLLQFERSDSQDVDRADPFTYNLVLRAYAKKGEFQGAEHWLRRMVSNGVEATVCSYNTVLDACAKADNAEACEAWLVKMLSKGVEANVISYATVIYAWARHGKEARAEGWLKKMLDAGISPDAVCYNSMIHACSVSGNPSGAEHWMEDMQARGLEASVTTFTAVIDACAKGGDVPRAEKWLEAMIAAKVEPNVVTFSAMIDACAKAADPGRAEHWHDRMIECNIKPNGHSISAVVNACAKAGDVARAEKWLCKSEEMNIANDVVVYSSVIDACGKAGDADRAAAIFQRMQENGLKPHIVAYAALARPYAYRGDWMEVERIAEDMKHRGIKPNEYFLYAQLLSYATSRPRQVQRAEDCFRDALRLGLKANDHVITALVRGVGHERCVELMNELCNGRAVPLASLRHDRPPGGSCLSRTGGIKAKPNTRGQQ